MLRHAGKKGLRASDLHSRDAEFWAASRQALRRRRWLWGTLAVLTVIVFGGVWLLADHRKQVRVDAELTQAKDHLARAITALHEYREARQKTYELQAQDQATDAAPTLLRFGKMLERIPIGSKERKKLCHHPSKRTIPGREDHDIPGRIRRARTA